MEVGTCSLSRVRSCVNGDVFTVSVITVRLQPSACGRVGVANGVRALCVDAPLRWGASLLEDALLVVLVLVDEPKLTR